MSVMEPKKKSEHLGRIGAASCGDVTDLMTMKPVVWLQDLHAYLKAGES